MANGTTRTVAEITDVDQWTVARKEAKMTNDRNLAYLHEDTATQVSGSDNEVG